MVEVNGPSQLPVKVIFSTCPRAPPLLGREQIEAKEQEARRVEKQRSRPPVPSRCLRASIIELLYSIIYVSSFFKGEGCK